MKVECELKEMLVSQRVGKKKKIPIIPIAPPLAASTLFFFPHSVSFSPLPPTFSTPRREPQITLYHHIKEKMRGGRMERGGGAGESRGGRSAEGRGQRTRGEGDEEKRKGRGSRSGGEEGRKM